MDPLNIARGGMTAASQRFEASAERLARAGEDPSVDAAMEAVNEAEASGQFKVNISVVRVADQMLSSLLEVQHIGRKD